MLDPSQAPNPVAGAATPSPSSDSLSGGLADKFSSAAQTAQPTPTQQPTAPTPAQPAPPDKHALLGRFVSHIKNAVEGRETVYTPDPNTGQVVETTQPRRAGGIFRDVLVGALAGMAASSIAPPRGGAAGFAIGAEGARENFQNQQDRARQKAQQSATSGFQQQQQLTQQQLAAAAVAHDNVSTLALGHFVPHFTDEEVGQYNDSVSAVRKVLLDNGGQIAEVKGNGEKGNGPALMDAYNRDNSLMSAPEGFHRVQSTTFDTTGLEHVGHQWVDPKTDKEPTDWNDRATVSLIDVPDAIWGKSVTLPGSVIKDIAPNTNLVRDPKKQYSTNIGSIFGLGLKNKKTMLDDRNELYRAPQNEQEALALKAEADQTNADPEAPADLKRRAAIKGPLAEKWLAGQAAQKKAMEEAGQKPAGAPKTVPEAGIARANAQFAFDKDPSAENRQALDVASAAYQGAVNSKKDELNAEYQSQLKLAAGKADAERRAKETYDRNLYSALTAGDPLGWTPKLNQYMTEQQFNSSKDKFASGTLSKAQDVEKSYSMFQDAYGEYKAAKGKLPTGAQSMLALSTHLSTTFGNVKGSRVTKDMIREHLGARSISDDALVAVQKLTSGDVLSPQQWKAFSSLITDSRNKTWDNTVNNAHYIGLPADFLPQSYVEDHGGSVAPQTPAPQPRSVPTNRTPRTVTPPATQGGFNWNALPKVQQ